MSNLLVPRARFERRCGPAVAASAHDNPVAVREEVARGRFREDLFLRGHEVAVPDLRDHAEDVPLYVNAFLRDECERSGRYVPGVTLHAMELLRRHPWPGNVRELEMTLRRIVHELPEDRAITHEDLPAEIRDIARDLARDGAPAADGLEAQVEALRRRSVTEALAATNGNQSEAARRLGLSRNGLRALMSRFGIER